MLTDPFTSRLATQLGYSAGSFRLCNWLSLRRLVSWINHLPPACWSTFWKSNFKQQLGCRFDIMDNKSHFFVFWHMQIYMSWSCCGFTSLNILYFFKYSCTNIFHGRSLYTFYPSILIVISVAQAVIRRTKYCENSNISDTKSQSKSASRLVLQLPLPNPLNPGVKSRMKM